MTQLLEIQPKELKFVFEVKKQSSCSIRLTNNAYHNVAFKVKTTSPKKYCVRPNVGIIDPKSTCEFIVTMQALKLAPPDMACKDKFLIQSTVVPLGTTEKDITPSTFAKDDSKHIEEVKMRVALICPPESPVLSPINGVLKQGPFFEPSVPKDPVLNRVEILNPPQMGPFFDPSVLKDPVLNRVEILTPPQTHQVAKDAEFKMTSDHESNTAEDVELKPKKDVIHGQESKLSNDIDWVPVIDIVHEEELKLEQDEELKQDKDAINNEHSKPAQDMESPSLKNEEIVKANAVELKLASDIEEMKSKLHVFESKLNETESTITKLTEEKRQNSQERKILQEELDFLRSRTSIKRVYVGFPLLFVVMIALNSIVLGYLLHR